MSNKKFIKSKIVPFLPVDIDKWTIKSLVRYTIANKLDIYSVNYKPLIFNMLCSKNVIIDRWINYFKIYYHIFTVYSYTFITIDVLDNWIDNLITFLSSYDNETAIIYIKKKINMDINCIRKNTFLSTTYANKEHIISNIFKEESIPIEPYVMRKIIDTCINLTCSDIKLMALKEFYSYECVSIKNKIDLHYYDYNDDEKKMIINELAKMFNQPRLLNISDPFVQNTISDIYNNINGEHNDGALINHFKSKLAALFNKHYKWGDNEFNYIKDKFFNIFKQNPNCNIEKIITTTLQREAQDKFNILEEKVPFCKNREDIIHDIINELQLRKIYVPIRPHLLNECIKKHMLKNAGYTQNVLPPHLIEKEENNEWLIRKQQADKERLDEFKRKKEEHEQKKAQIILERKEKNLVVPGIVAFNNIGNTCYMNAVLQCLNNLPCFVDNMKNINNQTIYINTVIRYYTDKKVKKDNIMDEYLKDKLDEEFNNNMQQFFLNNNISHCLKKILDEAWANPCKKITPQTFKKTLSTINELFDGNDQHDSCELLDTLFNRVHDEIKTEVTDFYETSFIDKFFLNYIENNSDVDKIENINSYIEYKTENMNGILNAEYKIAANKIMKDNGMSFIVNDFTGVYILLIKCDECNNITYRFDPFTILTLEFDENCKTINDCFSLFSKNEKLDEDNKYCCTICKKNTIATKQTKIWKLPKVLVIQLKRFCYDKELQQPFKKNDLIQFPINELNLDSLTYNNTEIFDLVGICSHLGRYGFGHYIATCKNSINNKWYKFDDSSEPKYIENTDEIINSSAYVLFYCIKN